MRPRAAQRARLLREYAEQPGAVSCNGGSRGGAGLHVLPVQVVRPQLFCLPACVQRFHPAEGGCGRTNGYEAFQRMCCRLCDDS